MALKAFPQFTRNYIRDEISTVNLLLLLNAIPPYRGMDEKKEGEKSDNKGKANQQPVIHWEQIKF